MVIQLELSPEVREGLLAEAQEHGLSLEAVVEQVLREHVQTPSLAGPPSEPFWKSFTRRVHALPDSVFDRLPKDGATEHDHYLYGAPKRDE